MIEDLEKTVNELKDLSVKHVLMRPPNILFTSNNLSRDIYINLIHAYIDDCISNLRQRISIISNDKQKDFDDFISIKIKEYKTMFYRWYKPGDIFYRYVKDIHRICNINREYFLRSITPNMTGIIVQKWNRDIQINIQSINTAREIAKRLQIDINNHVDREWRRTQERTINQISNLSSTREIDEIFSKDILSNNYDKKNNQSYINPKINQNIWSIIKSLHYDASVATSLIFIPISLLNPIITGITIYLGILSNEKEQIFNAKKELVRGVTDIMAEIYGAMITPNIEEIMDSPLDNFFKNISSRITDQIKGNIPQKLAVMKHEIEIMRLLRNSNSKISITLLNGINSQISLWEGYRKL